MSYLDRNLGLLNIVLGVAFFISTLTSFTAEASILVRNQGGLMTNDYLEGGLAEVPETPMSEDWQAIN